MKRAKIIPGIGAALGMLLLILDGKTAIAGAREGVELCLQAVIPSLFPFFVLSMLLTDSLSGASVGLLRPLERLCRVPAGSGPILLTGFLGGYPVGAQSAANGYRAGHLSKAQAQRMLTFCSNAGPSFLFGIVAAQFPKLWYGWLLWAIQLTSAVLVSACIPPAGSRAVRLEAKQALSLSDCLHRALKVMGAVCGWVVLFRVVIAFADRWFLWLLPKEGRVLFAGILELTNGCCALSEIDGLGLRLILAAGLLSFGGICVTMQTASVAGGLGIRPYLTGKCLQTVTGITLAILCQPLLPASQRCGVPPVWALILLIFLPLVRKKQKNSSNSRVLGV